MRKWGELTHVTGYMAYTWHLPFIYSRKFNKGMYFTEGFDLGSDIQVEPPRDQIWVFSLVFEILCNIVKFLFVFKGHAIFQISVETLIYSVTYIKKYLSKNMWREYRSDHCPWWKWGHDFYRVHRQCKFGNHFIFAINIPIAL